MTEHFEEFLRERRERAERTRGVLVGVLTFACIALVVSNVVLSVRLSSLRSRPAPEAPAPTAAASVPTVTEAPPAVRLPATTEPGAPRTVERAAPPPPATEPRAAGPADEPEGAPESGPPATAPRQRGVLSLPPGPTAAPAALPSPTAPDEVTAAWMLTTYGRAEALTRARAALAFYDARSPEAAYWRRVLTRLAER